LRTGDSAGRPDIEIDDAAGQIQDQSFARSFMMTRCRILLTGLLLAPGLFFGCSESPPAEPVVQQDATDPEAPAPDAVTPPEPTSRPAAETPRQESAPTKESGASPVPAGKPETAVPTTAPATDEVPVEAVPPVVPEATNRVIAVAGKPGTTRIGTEKCKMCHKVQHASWAESAHARQSPVLDCESCHGPGSEYKSMTVMKDPDKAREAGLVDPDKSFCTGSCHTDNWQDDMLGRAHAHKEETP
jgi:hypothetical protein